MHLEMRKVDNMALSRSGAFLPANEDHAAVCLQRNHVARRPHSTPSAGNGRTPRHEPGWRLNSVLSWRKEGALQPELARTADGRQRRRVSRVAHPLDSNRRVEGALLGACVG